MYLTVRGRNAQEHTDACVHAKESSAAQRSQLGCAQRTRDSTTEHTVLMHAALQQMTRERRKRKNPGVKL